MFRKLVESMRQFGYVQPIIVRELAPDRYEIINGEHRWRAARELNMPEIAVMNLGVIADSRAKQLVVILNELGGTPDQVRLSDLLRDINIEVSTADLLKVLPFTEKELSLYTETIDFSFANLSTKDTRVDRPAAEPDPVVDALAGESTPAPAAEPGSKEEGESRSEPKTRVVLRALPAIAHELEGKLARIDPDPIKAAMMAVDAYLDTSTQTKRAKKKGKS